MDQLYYKPKSPANMTRLPKHIDCQSTSKIQREAEKAARKEAEEASEGEQGTVAMSTNRWGRVRRAHNYSSMIS